MPHPDGCTRCGQCCTCAFIGLHSIRVDDDPQEFARWLAYHRCDVKGLPTEDGDVLMIRIPMVCKHLAYDKQGLASCKIYDTRPQICRDHLCDKLRSGAVPEASNTTVD